MKHFSWHQAPASALLGLATLAAAADTPPAIRSAQELAGRSIERRAVEAVAWGMPIVNFDRMLQAARAAKAEPNQIVYWSKPVDWRNQTLTPNPDTIYVMPFYDTRNGPVVLEIPPASTGTDTNSITGSIDDAWQSPLEDVGPAGLDKGAGGKYLILPPGYTGEVPSGYFALNSPTFQGFALLRSNFRSASEADIAQAVAYARRIKFYPLAQADKDPRTAFVDAYGTMFDATIPYDLRFFESLHRAVQTEPWLTRDKVMIDQLKTLGIEKDKPFAPDATTKPLLERAAREARALGELRYAGYFTPPYIAGTQWAVPASQELVEGLSDGFSKAGSYPTDARSVTYAMGFFSPKHLGQGQFYLMTYKDKGGRPLDGSKTYRLHVPANAPVKLYWSATAYDSGTHALIRDTERSSRGSNAPNLQKNADGSVDLFFGPKAPAGKNPNWVPTSARGRFEVLFRFYGPEKPVFDKTWQLPDLEAEALR